MPIIKPATIRCSGCRQTKTLEHFRGVRQPGRLTRCCQNCRAPLAKKAEYAREWRQKKKAAGVKYDTRGRTRNAYFRQYYHKTLKAKRKLQQQAAEAKHHRP
jgi:hypothetical protein